MRPALHGLMVYPAAAHCVTILFLTFAVPVLQPGHIQGKDTAWDAFQTASSEAAVVKSTLGSHALLYA